MGEDAEHRSAGEVGHPLHALLSRLVVHAQPGESADRPLSARDRVDADGRRRIRAARTIPNKCPFWPRVFRAATAITRRRSASGTRAPTRAMAAIGIIRSSGTGRRIPENAGVYYGEQIIEWNGKEKTVSGYSTDNYTQWACDYIQRRRTRQGEAVVPLAVLRRDSRTFDARPAAPGQVSRTRRSSRRPISCRRGRRSRSISIARRPGISDANGEIRAGATDAQFGDEGGRGKTHAEWVRQVNECALALDEGVGRVLDCLRESGQLENTLVVYSRRSGLCDGRARLSREARAVRRELSIRR